MLKIRSMQFESKTVRSLSLEKNPPPIWQRLFGAHALTMQPILDLAVRG
jgi:hypothetical protein